MHRRNGRGELPDGGRSGRVPWRRLAFALAVPAVAIGAIALTAGTAASSTGAPKAAQSEQPNQQPLLPQTGNPNLPKAPTSLKVPTSLPKTLTSRSATKSGSATPTTKSPSASTSLSPSPSPLPGGGVTVVPVPVPVPGGGGAAGACSTPMSPPVTVQIGTVGGKQALVNQAGCAIYMNNKDTPSASVCDATCLQMWHVVPGPAQAGNGVDQTKFNVFNRTDGTVQATYGGHQLYTFTGDTSPGQANGQGFQQTWFLLDANGNPITS